MANKMMAMVTLLFLCGTALSKTSTDRPIPEERFPGNLFRTPAENGSNGNGDGGFMMPGFFDQISRFNPYAQLSQLDQLFPPFDPFGQQQQPFMQMIDNFTQMARLHLQMNPDLANTLNSLAIDFQQQGFPGLMNRIQPFVQKFMAYQSGQSTTPNTTSTTPAAAAPAALPAVGNQAPTQTQTQARPPSTITP